MHETAKPCAKNPDLPSQCVQRVLLGVGNEEGLFFTRTGTSLVQKGQKPALWAEKLGSGDLTARKVSVIYIPAAESLPGQGTRQLEQRFLCSSSSSSSSSTAAAAAAPAAAAAAVTAVFFESAAAAAAATQQQQAAASISSSSSSSSKQQAATSSSSSSSKQHHQQAATSSISSSICATVAMHC